MADSNRASPNSLDKTQALSKLEAEPWEYSFFAAVRLFEHLYADKPLQGRAKLPRDEPVRLAAQVRLAFANSTVAKLDLTTNPGKPVLYSQFLGLLGPNGPMPGHLSDYAFSRAQSSDDPTLIRFLDIFHHRALSLFYRAWADALPAAQSDGEHDRFGGYLDAFIGMKGVSTHHLDKFSDHAKKSLVGLFAQQGKNADSLQRLLKIQFFVPVEIKQFSGEWTDFDEQNVTILGARERYNRLGISTVAGRRVWLTQHKFVVGIGPLSLRDFVEFLPGEARHDALIAAIRLFTADEFAWTIDLELAKDEVPVTRLGRQGRLGMTSWLVKHGKRANNENVHLRPNLADALG